MFNHSVKVKGFIAFTERLSIEKPFIVIFTFTAIDTGVKIDKPAKVSYIRKNGVGLKHMLYGNIKKLLDERLLKDFDTCKCGRKHLNGDTCILCECVQSIQ